MEVLAHQKVNCITGQPYSIRADLLVVSYDHNLLA